MDVVSLCNQALGWVGAAPITALDDGSRAAELCNENIGPARDLVLEARNWTFATERRLVAADATAPGFGFTYRYQVPTDVLRVVACDDGTDTWEVPHTREGAYILCDVASELRLIVVKREEDPNRWSPGFCEALAYKLAALLVIPLTENHTLQMDLVKLYMASLEQAARLDGRQGSPEKVVRSSGLDSARW